jgi:hypothetical protein
MAHSYMGRYYDSVLQHYELGGRHFGETGGYEYYARMSENVREHGAADAGRFFADLQVWGTPAQCLQKIQWIRSTVPFDRFMGVFQYGGMPIAEGRRNARLFASEVAPRLRHPAELAA